MNVHITLNKLFVAPRIKITLKIKLDLCETNATCRPTSTPDHALVPFDLPQIPMEGSVVDGGQIK